MNTVMSGTEKRSCPEVTPHQWINIGQYGLMDAVVVKQFEVGSQGDVQVIHIDQQKRPILESVTWNGKFWESHFDHPSGVRIERTETYLPFILQAEKGRW